MVEDVPREETDEDVPVVENAERLSSAADVHKSAWNQTISDMERMAEARREEGWETVELVAGDTAPIGRDDADESDEADEFGLSYVIPDDDADAFVAAIEDGEFPRTEVYRAEADSRVFLVTEVLDPETKTAIFIAGNFWRRNAQPLAEAAREAGEMYTFVQTLDTTRLGSFRHDDHEPFFPDADRLVQE